MKTIGRILIILVAALIVVGALVALTGGSSTSQAANPNGQALGAPPSGEFQGEHGENEGGVGGLTTIIKNAGIFAGLSVAVAGVSTLGKRLYHKAQLAA